jgi:hypothetical protein
MWTLTKILEEIESAGEETDMGYVLQAIEDIAKADGPNSNEKIAHIKVIFDKYTEAMDQPYKDFDFVDGQFNSTTTRTVLGDE